MRNDKGKDNLDSKRKPKPSGIARWPAEERPRERLLSRGPHALTDAELLAILLRMGMPGKNAVELGRELLRRFGSVQEMMAVPLSAWDGIKGLGNAKLAPIRDTGLLDELALETLAPLPARTRTKLRGQLAGDEDPAQYERGGAAGERRRHAGRATDLH